MRKIVVFDSAEELVDAFYYIDNAEGKIPKDVSLNIGNITNTYISFSPLGSGFDIAPHVTFEELFFELCKRLDIRIVRT